MEAVAAAAAVAVPHTYQHRICCGHRIPLHLQHWFRNCSARWPGCTSQPVCTDWMQCKTLSHTSLVEAVAEAVISQVAGQAAEGARVRHTSQYRICCGHHILSVVFHLEHWFRNCSARSPGCTPQPVCTDWMQCKTLSHTSLAEAAAAAEEEEEAPWKHEVANYQLVVQAAAEVSLAMASLLAEMAVAGGWGCSQLLPTMLRQVSAAQYYRTCSKILAKR